MEAIKASVPRRAARELLDIFPFGVILVSPTSRILAANRSASRILCQGDGLALEGQRLRAADPDETRELHAVVAATARNGVGELARGGGARPVSRPSGRRPLQLLVSRLGGDPDAGAEARRPSVALFVTDPDEPVEIPSERLRRLYGLTHSEARIASRLAAGLRPEDVGAELGVQTNTVRMHLKRIFAKTRTHRQSELVALLLRGAVRLDTPSPEADADGAAAPADGSAAAADAPLDAAGGAARVAETARTADPETAARS